MKLTIPKPRIVYNIHWKLNDGGRKEAGYKGHTGDCACRAIAIATGLPYKEVYNLINEYAKRERPTKRRPKRSHARTGVHTHTMHQIIESLGWQWKPTMKIRQSCKVHLLASELPTGKIIVRLSKHYSAVIDGVAQDTYDASRNGTRCVYGYWHKP